MSGDITGLINDSVEGDPEALQALLQKVYDDLRTIARARRRNERNTGELQTTALVHEALLRLADYNLESVNDS
ncbi:MAG: ECF-type sigma factor, partial [Woeseiaceae bacterium]|nr:ECF-type sigma factor [Woeseiaceae bacterium]